MTGHGTPGTGGGEPGSPEAGTRSRRAEGPAFPDPDLPGTVLAAYAPGLLDRVAEARDFDGLAAAAAGHGGLVRILAQVGLPVMAISRAVALLNGRLMDRLYRQTLPPEAVANSCLMVMGSEGRAEQILKTDQDNGLVLRDGFHWDGLSGALAEFSRKLNLLGWPPCKGGVMVTNPIWVRSAADWTDTVAHWVHLPRDESYMHLAIFADATAVAGDSALLDGVKSGMHATMTGQSRFFAHFAQVAVQFAAPIGLFGRVVTGGRGRTRRVDVKKGGIFPLVHGLRAMALEAGVRHTGTLARLEALVELGRIDRPFGMELREAFEFLVGLRLKVRLTDPDPTASDNLVALAQLAPDEREDLRHAFRTVRQFQNLLTYHFHLEMF